MAFFHPRAFTVADAGFQPLFRFLSDLENISSQDAQGQQQGRCGGRAAQRHCRPQRQHHHRQVRTFHPRFDVRETETVYELHGELPGVERENLQIEFTEPQTIAIRGRVERAYTSAAAVEDNHHNNDDAAVSTEIKEDLLMAGGDDAESFVTVAAEEQPSTTADHKATVTDEDEEAAKEQGTPTPEPAAAAAATATAEQPQQHKPADKYWISERSIGEFSRTFEFPSRVEQEAVSANLKDGILSVVVPKAKKHEARRIDIA